MAAEEKDQDSVLNYYRRLLHARQSREMMIQGSFAELLAEHEQIFAYERKLGEQKAVILMNFTDETAIFDAELLNGLVPVINSEASGTVDDESYQAELLAADQVIREGKLPPLSAIWYERR